MPFDPGALIAPASRPGWMARNHGRNQSFHTASFRQPYSVPVQKMDPAAKVIWITGILDSYVVA
jgi:hypothetical protein